MNRRQFFSSLFRSAATAAAMVYAPRVLEEKVEIFTESLSILETDFGPITIGLKGGKFYCVGTHYRDCDLYQRLAHPCSVCGHTSVLCRCRRFHP